MQGKDRDVQKRVADMLMEMSGSDKDEKGSKNKERSRMKERKRCWQSIRRRGNLRQAQNSMCPI